MSDANFGFDFDNIGNRELYTTTNGTEYTYLVNALNQYTNIHNGVTNTPTYDADGNMLTYGDWTFDWTGENRLQTASNSTSGVVIENAYDYQGRRFRKIVDDGSTVTTNTFIYDGWNLIAETTKNQESGTTNYYYVWGPDLSGSMQGAGGIGGLLSVISSDSSNPSNTSEYFPCFDANGNITEYVDETGTNVVAHYEYGPFGGTITATGTKKDDFHFRFSTKYLDEEPNLYYYGYRYWATGSDLKNQESGVDGSE
jgi:hypothetical protein